ncbi:thioredoxin-like protein [Suillus ampliporus]|nr:thioredoxin-like protein [Suillus ampliporus]
MPEQLTLYSHKLSPYSHRIELALAEANVEYKAYQVDLFDKPKWFAAKVNPIGKVPAIAYGGPDVDPSDPSPLSFKLTESNVILQFVAELYPESGLLPKDPVERAKVLFFMDTVDRHFDRPGNDWMGGRTESYDGGLLSESDEFAVGDRYTIADACIAPLLSRLKITYETDIGGFPVGQGIKLGEALKAPKYAKFMKYAQVMLERPSLRDTNDETYLAEFWKRLITERRQ